MASKSDRTAKIVIYKDDVNGNELASTVPSINQTDDAFSFMQGTDIAGEDMGLVNEEAGLFSAQLTDSESQALIESDAVEDVIDDETMYALEGPMGGFGGGDEYVLDPTGPLEDDPEQFGEFDEEDYLSELPEDEEGLTPANARLLSEVDSGLTDEEIEYEIGLRDEVAAASADQLQDSIGGTKSELKDLIARIIKCMAEKNDSADDVSAADISQLLQNAGVQSANAASAAEQILWNIRMIYAPYAWRWSRGGRARVAIVDTGIYSAHPDLRVWGGVSYVPGNRNWTDNNGHGTHVAGIVAALHNRRGVVGVAPSARLYAVKVLNRRGSGSLSSILAGLSWCIKYRMHVANLSLGSLALTHNPRVYNLAYEKMGRRLMHYGVLPIAAAGNSGASSRPYVNNPARCPSYMAVTSIDRRRRRSSFSSYGPQAEITAPGSGILSTYPRTTYRALSGTSMAAPHVSGVAALVKSRRPTWSAARIRYQIDRTAIDLGQTGRDWAYGHGMVNAYSAVVR